MANTFNQAKTTMAKDKVLESKHNELIDILSQQIKIINANITNGLTIVKGMIQLALSSTTTDGALSSTDWNTFNGKQDALTFGIANNNAVKINAPDVASGEYARFTTSGLESRTIDEIKTELNIVSDFMDSLLELDILLNGEPGLIAGELDIILNGG